MALPVQQFQILSPEQANPIGSGLRQGADLYTTLFKNALLRHFGYPEEAAKLQSSQLANQKSLAEQPYWGPQAAATLATTQAQPGLMGSESAANYAQASRAPFENALAQQQAKIAGIQANNPLLLAGDTGQTLWALGQGNNSSNLGNLNGSGGNVNSNLNPNTVQGSIIQRKLFPLQYAQQEAQIPEWNTALNEANTESSDAQNVLSNLEKFHGAYKDAPSYIKGYLGGKLPGGLSSDAQIMDLASPGLQLSQDQALHLAHNTNLSLGLIGKSKPSRSLNQQAEQSTYDLLKSGFMRQQEHGQFLQAAQELSQQNPELGLSRPIADSLYQSYNRQYPIFDEQGKAKPENLGSKNWKQFLTPEAIQGLRSGNLPNFNNSNKNPNINSYVIAGKSGKNKTITDDDINYTAKQRNTTPEHIKQLLGIQ